MTTNHVLGCDHLVCLPVRVLLLCQSTRSVWRHYHQGMTSGDVQSMSKWVSLQLSGHNSCLCRGNHASHAAKYLRNGCRGQRFPKQESMKMVLLSKNLSALWVGRMNEDDVAVSLTE